MLVGSRAVGVAVFVPVSFVALTGSMSFVALQRLVVEPSVGVVFSSLLSIVFLGVVLSMIRVVRVSGDRVIARGLFDRRELTLASTAIGARREGGRSANHEVYAMDGSHRVVLASTFTGWGARHAVRRFERLLGLDDDTGGAERMRAPARAAIAATHEAEQRADEDIRRIVAENQRRYGWLSVVIVGIFVAAIVAYIAVMVALER